MADENEPPKSASAKSDWNAGIGAKPRAFFKPEDFDIYVNKLTGDTYIFHGPPLPFPVDRLEFSAADNRVTVYTKDGQAIDLGVKVQWLVRPYFKRAKTVFIVQTKNGKSIDGVEVPMTVKE